MSALGMKVGLRVVLDEETNRVWVIMQITSPVRGGTAPPVDYQNEMEPQVQQAGSPVGLSATWFTYDVLEYAPDKDGHVITTAEARTLRRNLISAFACAGYDVSLR